MKKIYRHENFFRVVLTKPLPAGYNKKQRLRETDGKMYKNIEKQQPLKLRDEIEYCPGQIVSKTLVQNSKLSMTLFAFEKGEEVSAHAAGDDAIGGNRPLYRGRQALYPA